jgi:uncharacterized protein with von Willebrand factor type A (vWA) domain
MSRKGFNWWKPARRSVVVPTKTGPSSYRYEAKSVMEPTAKTTYPSQGSSVGSVYGAGSYGRTKWGNDWEDDDLYSGRTRRRNTWTPTRWSTFSFSTILDDDDNSELFVKEPETYLTPTASEIKAKVNVFSKEKLDRIKDFCRVCYFKMIDERDYISEYGSNMEGSEAYEKKKELYDNVFENYIPGFTPLEQAIAIHHQLEDKEAKRNRGKAGGRHRSDAFEFRRDDYADPTINEQLEMNPLSKERKLDILSRISIIGDLGSQFKVERETGEKVVANSSIFRKRIMRDYDQFLRMDLYQKMFPDFRIKFLTKNLTVNVPVQTSERKQKIIILCDYSGSMDDPDKQIWVNALLIDRFRYVIRGEAEVFFSYFVSNPSQLSFTHVKNAKDVSDFWKRFDNYPNGSYTDIGRIVTHVSEEINSGKLQNLNIDLSKEKPEILIINDGQDEVGYEKFPYRVNAISLIQFSDELKRLCVATGGKQVKITRSNDIIAYSKEGEEIIN